MVPALLLAGYMGLANASGEHGFIQSGPYEELTFSEDGRFAMTLKEGNLSFWNARNENKLKTIQFSGKEIQSASFSPDCRYVFFTVREESGRSFKEVRKLSELLPEPEWPDSEEDLSDIYGAYFSDDDVGLFEGIEGNYDSFILSYLSRFDTRKKMLEFFDKERKKNLNPLKYAIYCGMPEIVRIIGERAVTFRIISSLKLTKYISEARAREHELSATQSRN